MHVMTTVDDQTILAGLRAGDQQAFETLVRVYGGRLLAVARRFVRNDEDAQDIVQSA
jgi:RNA polymerase sigma-70 factor, ECF subfamily